MQLFLVDQTVMIDVDSMKSLCFGQTTIFNSYAELIDYFWWWNLFVVDGSFQLRVQFLILKTVFLYLLDWVKTTDRRYKLLPGDLAISVEVQQVHPFAYLVSCLLGQ